MNKSLRLTCAVLASTLFVVPPASYADVTISTPFVNRDTKTSVDGDITITQNGQLAMTLGAPNSGDAILIDSVDADITIDAANVNAGGNAIVTSGLGRYGINVAAAGADITLGAQSAITSGTNDAIFINATDASVTSTGTISGNVNAIDITNLGTNAAISLMAGSTTQGNTGPSIRVDGTGLTFGNAGTVASTGQDAILLLQNFSNFQNNATGVIEVTAGAGNAINLNNAAGVSGDLDNNGLINVDGTGAAIRITNTFNGSILNHSTGVISSSGGGGKGILINAGFGSINNEGTIITLGTDIAISVTANAAGTINNSGSIEADNNAAIDLGGNITGILNTGTIENDSATATINVSAAGVDLINGIENRGTITNLLGDAIDLSTGDDIVFKQTSGTVTGDVHLAGKGGAIFTMAGGTILGDVFANDAAANTLTLSGGTIAGSLLLGVTGDTVNLSGTTVDSITGDAGNDIVNVSGGSILTALSGAAGANQLNIDATYTSNSTISNFQTINVNAGTFTVNKAVTGLNTLLDLDPGTAMYAYANITGTGNMTNDGSFYVLNNSTTNLTPGTITNNSLIVVGGGSLLRANTFTQTATGIFAPIIDSTTSYGAIQVGAGGASLALGSVIYPYLSGTGFVPAGSLFNIVTGGAVVDNSTLQQPASTTLYFTKSVVGGNILQLAAQRNTYASVVQGIPPSMTGIAEALDGIAAAGTTDPTLLTVLGQLDALPSALALENALINLSPNVNYALVQGTHLAMNSVFNSIEFRIETMQDLKPLGSEGYVIYNPEVYFTGRNYGDGVEGVTGVWIEVYGSLLNQKFYKNVSGYNGDLVGYVIGVDWGSPETLVVGFAGSYTNTHTVGNSLQANILDVQTIQGTFYAWYSPPCQSFFADLMFGFSENKYYSRRNIGVGTFSTAAFADFYGYQYAVQSDLGYAFTYDFLTIAPIGRFKYSYLGIDSYTEDGAAGVSLSSANNSINELIGGVGLKFLGTKKFSTATYVPELSAMVLYDFYGQGQQLTSNFFGGGGLFPTDGPRPSHTIYLYSVGVTAYTYDNYSFEVRYDLEIRDRYHYYGNSGFMQLRGEWG